MMSRVAAEEESDWEVVDAEDKEPLGVLRLARPLGFGDRDFALRWVIGGGGDLRSRMAGPFLRIV
jgi:hypothetical protein